VRGYGYQGAAARAGWGRGTSGPGIGVQLKRRLHDAGDWTMSMTAFGEALPRHENVVTLSDAKDEFGIPVLRIDCSWGPNELAMRKDMRQSAIEMLEAAGCTNIVGNDDYKEGGLGAEPGLGIHEMGTARMGRDPKTSAVNGFCQAHDVPNLFVTDGSVMASASCVNPSITYMALTARAADYAVDQLKKRNI
jgi:choline dehydrogenase-like flavoprotein